MNGCFLGSAVGILGLLLAAVIIDEPPPERAGGHFSEPADPFIPAYLREHGSAVPLPPFGSPRADAWRGPTDPHVAPPSFAPHASPGDDRWTQGFDARRPFAIESRSQPADFDW